MKNLFTKEDIKNIIRWIVCVMLIYVMGFAEIHEFIIGALGIILIVFIINLIQLIFNKITKNKEKCNE